MNEKVIIVTGASRGIGAGLCTGFARQGHTVIINYSRSEGEARSLYESILPQSSPERLLLVQADVAKRVEVQHLFEEALQRFGRIDALIANAGLNSDGPFLEMSDEAWQRVIDVSLTGTFICAQEFAKRFKGEDGRMITLAATTGLTGRKNGANYCSAKAGVITLTKCLALELAPRIQVNCILPGYIATDEVLERYQLRDPEKRRRAEQEIPAGRMGRVEDIFITADFLVNQASYITGQNFFVNGGNYMR